MATSIVVGGTKGIGSVLTSKFKTRGDNVYTVSRSKIKDSNHLSIDLSEFKSLISLKKIIQKIKGFSEIDFIVFTQRYRGQEDIDKEFNLMVKSTKYLIEDLSDLYSKSTSIVILGSPVGKFISMGQSQSYHITRAALEQLAKHYAVELGPKGVRVNCVMPGTIIKPENKEYFINNPERINKIKKITPLRRIGTSEDIADLILFLCSKKSSFITGQNIFIDGGMTLLWQESILEAK